MNIDISSVHLPDMAFWQNNDEVDRGLDPLLRKYKFSHFGVLIDAPHEVMLPSRDTLPVFAYYMGSYRQVATHSFPKGALLVAVDPDTNMLWAAPFMADSGEDIPVRESTPPDQLPEGYLSTFQALDARERVRLPWKPSRVILQVILLDLASNRVETKLEGGPGLFVDEEKESFLKAERAKLNPPSPFPALPRGAYAEGPDSPPLPEGFGIALAAPRVAVLDGKQKLYLRGSWRLPVFPEELVKQENSEYNKAHGLMQMDGFTPYAACVTIHVLVLGSQQSTPMHYQLQLPVSKLAAGFETLAAVGRFTIELTELPGFPKSDQTLFIYGYARDWAAEAVKIGLVDRITAQ